MSVDEAGGLKIKGYDWDEEQGAWVAKVTFTLEQLQAMSVEEKIAAAPSIEELQASGQIASEIDPAKITVKVEAGHVVTYTYEKKHVAAYDLRLGEVYDQMAYVDYGAEIQRVFFDNRWDYSGYTPSLEERGMLMKQILMMVEGSFAVNYGFREGVLRLEGQALMAADGTDLRTTAKRLAFFKNVLLPYYREAMVKGTLAEQGKAIPLDNFVKIQGQLPDTYVVFEYDAENTTRISSVDGKPEIGAEGYRWVKQIYDEKNNTLKITIAVDEKMARMMNGHLVGGPILVSLGGLTLDPITSFGIDDMRGPVLLNALGVPNLGPERDGGRYGGLNSQNAVRPVFEGLEPIMYNREK